MHVIEAKGAKIPAIGLGTWELRGRSCARLVEQAIRLGYRHFDTAQIYENEREVGEGLLTIGKPHGKTAAQVSLRWLVQQNVAAIARTLRIERLSEKSKSSTSRCPRTR